MRQMARRLLAIALVVGSLILSSDPLILSCPLIRSSFDFRVGVQRSEASKPRRPIQSIT